MQIKLHQVSKQYNSNWIFKNINYTIPSGAKLAVLGINGSGKSTLLQVISGHVAQTIGNIAYEINQELIPNQEIYKYVSYCAPAMELVQEFTIEEFLTYHFKFKEPLIPIDQILNYISLSNTKNVLLKNCSSGMLQRVKLAQAIFAKKELLILDEPTSNLDNAGIALYENLIKDFTKNCTIIIGSNVPKEYSFCNTILNINDYK